ALWLFANEGNVRGLDLVLGGLEGLGESQNSFIAQNSVAMVDVHFHANQRRVRLSEVYLTQALNFADPQKPEQIKGPVFWYWVTSDDERHMTPAWETDGPEL